MENESTQKNLFYSFGGRKFLIAIGLLIAAMLAMAFGLKFDDSWFSFIKWIVGLYYTSNIGADLVSKLGEVSISSKNTTQ